MAATFSTLKPRGKLFEKGMKKTGGRKAGAQNVATLAVKQMIACAAAGLGGTARLIEWAKESERNEYAFWVHIWPRLLPLQVQGTGARGELELNLKLNREEFTKRLLERGCRRSCSGSTRRSRSRCWSFRQRRKRRASTATARIIRATATIRTSLKD